MADQYSESQTVANRSMPPGLIIPELIYPDLTTAVMWLCTTFGFSERLRIGDHRVQLLVGATAAIVAVQAASRAFDAADGAEGRSQRLTHALMVRVANVDQHYAHALACGARVVQPPTDFAYGERQYTVEDLAGHRWTFTQSIADVDPRAWGGLLRDSAAAAT